MRDAPLRYPTRQASSHQRRFHCVTTKLICNHRVYCTVKGLIRGHLHKSPLLTQGIHLFSETLTTGHYYKVRPVIRGYLYTKAKYPYIAGVPPSCHQRDIDTLNGKIRPWSGLQYAWGLYIINWNWITYMSLKRAVTHQRSLNKAFTVSNINQ